MEEQDLDVEFQDQAYGMLTFQPNSGTGSVQGAKTTESTLQYQGLRNGATAEERTTGVIRPTSGKKSREMSGDTRSAGARSAGRDDPTDAYRRNSKERRSSEKVRSGDRSYVVSQPALQNAKEYLATGNTTFSGQDNLNSSQPLSDWVL